MKPLDRVLIENDTSIKPIWIMRQAGRYLPEVREIRKKNSNFISLCLSENLSYEITLQPVKRFNLDAAIIFSDILMLPYGLGQKVEFEKKFGPTLLVSGDDLRQIFNLKGYSYSERLILNKKFIPAEEVTINYISGENQWKRA